LLLIAALSSLVVWRVVGKPVRDLHRGTEHLAAGDLGFQIKVHSADEIGELARSFNEMSRELESDHKEKAAWTHTLEQTVEHKTNELKRAHEHALHTEKMASIGKMAAVLAHEINNPLSGILTYAKLLRRWLEHGDSNGHQHEICESLDLIASESRRCGDLVRNLLTFSRTTPMNLQETDLNQVIERSLRLVQHQCDLAGIQVQTQIDPALPLVLCDGAQIEQVLLALMMNAVDAMPQGGNLWITASCADKNVCLVVRDDGSGIPPEILPRIFEPFLTTKETGRGVGLGLAICQSIIERHHGNINVQSAVGQGTTFTLTLPCGSDLESVEPGPTEHVSAVAGGR
jgi:two-component system NtrC family sensor kinase